MIAATALMIAVLGAEPGTPRLTGAQFEDHRAISDPAQAAPGWIAFAIPAQPGTRSRCCWSGHWQGPKHLGCDLDSPSGFIGTWDDAPKADQLTVYARVDDEDPRSLLLVGDSCPVRGNGEVVQWLGTVGEAPALEWLARATDADDDHPVAHEALYAIASFPGTSSDDLLEQLARDGRKGIASNAVFWLGEARGEPGFQRLRRLLSELPVGPARRQINFALSQSKSPHAGPLLVDISRTDRDREQRGEALFWLAESNQPGALERLVEAVETDRDREVRDRALHGLSELKDPGAARALAGIARDHWDHHTQGQSLFWLAQGFPDRAEVALMDILSRESDRELLHQAVFAASQLPDARATDLLLKLARGDYPREVRRQAVFWLAQSDDQQAVEALAQMLAR